MADTKKPYGDVTYADPKNGKYPIDTEAHARAAWSYINMPKNAAVYPLNGVSLSEVKDRIRAACRKFGIDISDGDSGSDGSGGRGMPAEIERRYTPGMVECRAAGDDGKRIAGYASVFGKLSRNLGGFVEIVEPTSFNKSRADGFPGAVCRYNHDPNFILGTTAGRTLELRVDSTGLWYEVLPPQARADILELVGRGDVQHSSFAFRVPPGGDEWAVTDQSYPMRSLREVHLVDVAPVFDPAYVDATAGLRSLAAHVGAPLDEVRAMADADELRKFFIRTDNRGRPAPKPKPTLLGAAALTQLMERRDDPWIDEG